MPAITCTCPECQLVFEAPPSPSGLLTCPICDTRFPAAPPPAAGGRSPGVGAAVVLLACVAFGFTLVARWLPNSGAPRAGAPVPDRPATRPDPAPGLTPEPAESPDLSESPEPPAPPPYRDGPVPPPARPRQPAPPDPVLLPPLPATAALAERVNRAIDRGVVYLRARGGGRARHESLVGLALLECGVPASDPAVRRIADSLRAQRNHLAATYELALAVLFLDRLGNPEDRTLIRTYALRLAAGQLDNGAWTYRCPLLKPTDEQDLLTRLQAEAGPPLQPDIAPTPSAPPAVEGPQWRQPGSPRPAEKQKPPTKPAVPLPRILVGPDLHPAPSAPPRPPARRKNGRPAVAAGDRSNTQFALLGLWVARRHRVPVEPALRRAEQHFRSTQNADGSWSYLSIVRSWTASGTCSGLLALAMGHGVRRPGAATWGVRPEADPAVGAAIDFLGRATDRPPRTRGGNRILGADTRGDLYFLWSLERVAVIYGLKTIGYKEWYPWAARLLVDAQRPDGSWQDVDGPVIDTCFALLVLKRTNFYPDLTATVRKLNRAPALPPPPPTDAFGPLRKERVPAPGPVPFEKPRPK